MLLKQLLSVLQLDSSFDKQSLEVEISGLAIDSRQVQQGGLFIALKGALSDGRDYIAPAIKQGAVAVLYQAGDGFEPAKQEKKAAVCLAVDDLAQKLGALAAAFYHQPSEKMQLIGVTGTNGKTSISFIVAQLLSLSQRECVLAGTLGNGTLGNLQPSTNTTSDVLSLNALLAQHQQQGVDYAALEVSSHGIVQGRVNGVNFASLIFSNLSHDHLDFHGDYQSYGKAKLSLLTDWPAESLVVDFDDSFIQPELKTLQNTGKKLILVSQREPKQLPETCQSYWQIQNIQAKNSGCAVELLHHSHGDCDAYRFEVPVLGAFNVKNILLAAAALVSLGFDFSALSQHFTKLELPSGRMQLVNPLVGDQPAVVVDYAHTPDALEQVLLALKQHVQKRLICVFGCGGDRDTSKRNEMGEISELHADRVIVTNDNPRSEAPEIIAANIQSTMFGQAQCVLDRRLAINTAISEAKAGDLVLIAGKGHEQYQDVMGEKLAFDDVSVALEALTLSQQNNAQSKTTSEVAYAG